MQITGISLQKQNQTFNFDKAGIFSKITASSMVPKAKFLVDAAALLLTDWMLFLQPSKQVIKH